jgi:hypothetical protein
MTIAEPIGKNIKPSIFIGGFVSHSSWWYRPSVVLPSTQRAHKELIKKDKKGNYATALPQ